MLHLFFARHGETIWNTQNRMQGRQDTELTDLGRQQAHLLGRKLADLTFDQVYLSPAPRARKTASLAFDQAGTGLPATLITDERVQEMDLGTWEGLSMDEVKQADSINFDHFMHKPESFIPTGTGETFTEVSQRIADFLQDMERLGQQCLQDDTEKRILLISHNITLKSLLALMKRWPLPKLREGPPLKQAELYHAVYQQDGSWLIETP